VPHLTGGTSSRGVPVKAQHAAGGAGLHIRGTPVPPENGGRVTSTSSRGAKCDLSNRTKTLRGRTARGPLLRFFQTEGNSVPCLHNRRGGEAREGRGETVQGCHTSQPPRYPVLRRRIPASCPFPRSPASPIKSEPTPSATTITRTGPFEPTAPPYSSVRGAQNA
jgi:hypothetical protein